MYLTQMLGPKLAKRIIQADLRRITLKRDVSIDSDIVIVIPYD